MTGSESNLLLDLLSFRLLITPSLLVLVYYFGAVIMPLMGFMLYRKLARKASSMISEPRKGQLRESLEDHGLGKRYKRYFMLLALLGFIMMEIAWRMLIEFFIAYFQMHNALMHLQTLQG